MHWKIGAAAHCTPHVNSCLSVRSFGTTLAALILTMGLAQAQAQQELIPRLPGAKMTLQELQSAPQTDRVVVKFREGSNVRSGGSGQLTGMAGAEAGAFSQALGEFGIPSSAIQRMHSRPEADLDAEKAEGERRSGRQLADLNLYYFIDLPAGASAAAVADRLNALPNVEHSEPAPVPSPLPVDIAPPTPNFTGNQGYKGNAPTGIGANAVAATPGGTGANMRFADVEYSWQYNHEDLELTGPRIILPSAACVPQDPFNTDHGTAVLGELVGLPNAYGVTGIAPAAFAYTAPANCSPATGGFNPAAAINAASSILQPGDVILIEQQAPACGGACGANQVGCGPQEAIQAVFDAISSATANGRVVVQAAGNGNVNLDAAACNNLFNRNVRDSRAIMVGAGSSVDRSRLAFSSFGSRVDVQGWGQNVMTTGYGDAFNGGNDIRQRYTATFGGTSSASPIVTGAVLAIQGMRKACGFAAAGPLTLRQALASTGSAQTNPGTGNIGPLPRIREALVASGGDCSPGPPGPVSCQFNTRLRDFNADGRADIFLRRPDGLASIYLLNGLQILDGRAIGAIGNDWQLVGINDFNGDGRADLLFRRPNGQLSMYLMNGFNIVNAAIIGAIGTDWDIVGVGDFNGDGRADFVTRRKSDGLVAIYFMNGFQVADVQLVGVIGLEWKIQGIADFNGTGRSGILLRRTTDGAISVFLFNGAQIIDAAIVGIIGTDWTIVGVGDFNGDGRADFITRRANGTLGMYLLNGTQLIAGQAIGAIGTDWTFIATGDINGDGRHDMMFRRSTGALSGYLLNGFQIVSGQIMGNIGTDWTSCYGQGNAVMAEASE